MIVYFVGMEQIDHLGRHFRRHNIRSASEVNILDCRNI